MGKASGDGRVYVWEARGMSRDGDKSFISHCPAML